MIVQSASDIKRVPVGQVWNFGLPGELRETKLKKHSSTLFTTETRSCR